jgi:hypothetical protein
MKQKDIAESRIEVDAVLDHHQDQNIEEKDSPDLIPFG